MSVETAKRTAKLAPKMAAPTGKIDGSDCRTESLTGAKSSGEIKFMVYPPFFIFLGLV